MTINKNYKNFEGFENKDDIFEIMEKFDKSSLFELDINISNGSEVRIKMTKLADTEPRNARVAVDKIDNIDNIGEIDDVDGVNDSGVFENFEKFENNNSKESVAKNIIKAPLIGTFYASPSPEAEPYVKIGDKVTKDSVVCIIEAMKTMNEIVSDSDGVISEILVKDGRPVEYGQALFSLK